MGWLSSCVKPIGEARFEALPSRKLKNIKAVVCIGHIVFAESNNGTIYTTGEMSKGMHLCGTGSDYPAVKALVAFGIITAKQALEHGAAKRDSDANYKSYRAAICSIDDLEKAGIKLTKSQLKKIADCKEKVDLIKLPYWTQKEAAAKLGR